MFRRCFALLAVPVVCAAAGPASAFDDWTGRWGGTLSLYGQFSPSYINVDDGTESNGAVVDNSHSVSRIGLILRRSFGDGEFRFRFETSLGVRQSDAVSQTYIGPAFDWTRDDIRYLDLIWDRGSAGKFSIGHGSMATDQVAMADLSGTNLVNEVSVPDLAGGFEFLTSAGALSGTTVKSAYKTFDGVRRARLRYDRPVAAIDGLVLSVSAGAEILKKNNNENNFDVSATYQRDFGTVRVEGAAGASLTKVSGLTTKSDLVGSFSALHEPTGLSATIAAGLGNTAGQLVYFKLGYQADLFGAGPTAFSVDTYLGTDIAFPGSVSRAWGFGVVQHLRRPDVQVYLGFRRYRLSDATPATYLPMRAVQFGTRWQF